MGKRGGRMQNRRQLLGKTGEDIAVNYLLLQGYTIMERNYRTCFGEIDIIAKDGNSIAFIEVKSRTSKRFGDPKWAITPKKQRTISMVALYYLKQTQHSQVKARFDVLTVNSADIDPRVQLIKNAFELAYT